MKSEVTKWMEDWANGSEWKEGMGIGLIRYPRAVPAESGDGKMEEVGKGVCAVCH